MNISNLKYYNIKKIKCKSYKRVAGSKKYWKSLMNVGKISVR